MIDWLLSPISGADQHSISSAVSWHARSMVLAWAVLVPSGILAARYWKRWPGQNWPKELDNKNWWNIHRVVQTLAFLLMAVGVWLIWENKDFASTTHAVHGYLGWALCLSALLQIIGGLVRGSKGGPTEPQMRGDHFDMTPRRRRFEWIHKTVGWTSLCLSVVTIILGLYLADAPRWMFFVLSVWWLVLIGLAVRWQSQKKCIDTYQAIWGIDSRLPGLAKAPIGWGIFRGDRNETS